jgi:thymidylate synthase
MLRKISKGKSTGATGATGATNNPENLEEEQYLNLIRDILSEGTLEQGRNGNTKCVFGAAMHFSLDHGVIPILTTKRVAWKTCLKELLWFIKGDTNNEHLKEQGVTIWNDNASRDFLDSRGLTHLRENDLGPVYGHQWRHFNAKYTTCDENYDGKGVDQLEYIINCLKDPAQRTSRRMIMSAWNPCQLDEMALPPCHILVQFNVTSGNKLSCCMFQRSADVALGVPFNIASYSFLTHLLAKHCGLEAHEFIYYLGNAHIYESHLDAIKEQLTRAPYNFPTIAVKAKRENINDYTIDDFELRDYKSHDVIKMKMVA